MNGRGNERGRPLRLVGPRPLLLASGFTAALALGFLGYRDAEPGLSVSTALFKSVQLFVLEGGVVDGGTPWTLEIARFLAPAVLGYAAIRGVMVLARDQLMVWRTQLLARGHVVVAGDSSRMGTIATQLLEGGHKVVLLAPDASSLANHREHGVTVLEGDPRDPLILARARPERASNVVVASGSDADALRTLAACEAAAGNARGLAIHVGLTEPRLWEELHSVGLAEATRTRSVEFFLAADREARIMMRDVTTATVVVEGEGVIVDRLVVLLARAALLDRRSLELILGPRAASTRDAILEASPWIADATTLSDGSEPPAGRPFVALVAGVADAAGIAYGARLARAHPTSQVRVAIADGAVDDALARSRLREPNLELIPAISLALGPTLLTGSAAEIIARAKHGDYVRRETVRGVTASENPSVVAWDELPESLQVSNRRFAASVAHKLQTVGAELTPFTSLEGVSDLSLPGALLEDLAKDEHDRWVRDLSADGWRSTDGAKDPERKLHPLLIGWDELEETEREKDRDGFRALPSLLARAGYRLTIPDDAEPR